jgi:hypothetical protein
MTDPKLPDPTGAAHHREGAAPDGSASSQITPPADLL